MRLTKKENNKYVYDDIYCGEHINKLGQLEDIEEELGIDLVTLFKALKEGFWYKINQLVNKTEIWQVGYNLNLKLFRVFNDIFYFKDYGKTWALTKEELL